MKLIDMLIPKKTKKQLEAEAKESPVTSSEYEQDRYPYGLELTLDKREIDKLNLGSFQAGTMVSIEGMGKVTRVNITDKGKERTRHSISIQVQKVGITPKETPKASSFNDVVNKVSESRRA